MYESIGLRMKIGMRCEGVNPELYPQARKPGVQIFQKRREERHRKERANPPLLYFCKDPDWLYDAYSHWWWLSSLLTQMLLLSGKTSVKKGLQVNSSHTGTNLLTRNAQFQKGMISISLVSSDVEQLFICLLAFVYLLWRNIYSSCLPIFESVVWFVNKALFGAQP